MRGFKMLKIKRLLLWVLVGAFILSLTLLPNPQVLADTGTTIDTTTLYMGWANCYPFQIKEFYANSRIWIFYGDGINVVYKTSLDGITWSPKTPIINGGYGGFALSIVFDGAYLHYAFNSAATGEDLLYRMGTPNSNGTITWANVGQTVQVIPADANSMYCQITIDSNGYPWIAYCYKPLDFPTRPAIGYVTKSSTKNGIWTTSSGYPYNLTGNHVNTLPIPHIAALTEGKMYIVYNPDSFTQYDSGVLWSGGWGSLENATHIASVYYNYGIITSVGDDVYFVYATYETNIPWYVRKRTYGVGWGDALSITDYGNNGNFISITHKEGSHFILSWADRNSSWVKYRELDNGVLGDIVNWIDETSEGFVSMINNNAFLESNPICSLGLTYITRTASPYNVKFAMLTSIQSPPPPPPVNPPTTVGTTLYGTLASLGDNAAVNVYFQYGLTTNYGTNTAEQVKIVTGDFNQVITGLTASTTYHFRAVVRYGTSNFVYGNDATFRTSIAGAPSVLTRSE